MNDKELLEEYIQQTVDLALAALDGYDPSSGERLAVESYHDVIRPTFMIAMHVTDRICEAFSVLKGHVGTAIRYTQGGSYLWVYFKKCLWST